MSNKQEIKILVFDIFADYGHFRKIWTTSSPETYSFPAHSTIAGMLGSIIGVGLNDKFTGVKETKYLEIFNYNDCYIGVRIINPIVKFRSTLSLINTKNNSFEINNIFDSQIIYSPICVRGEYKRSPYTIVNIQLLKNPYYRIYVYHKNSEIFNLLCKCVKNKQIFYHLYLGKSEYLADYKFVGIYVADMYSNINDNIEIKSLTVIPKRKMLRFILDNSTNMEYEYVKEDIFPIAMDTNREVKIYDEIIYERKGLPVCCCVTEYAELKELVDGDGDQLNDSNCIVFY